MHTTMARLESSRIALRMTFGLVPLLAGLDKFTYLLTDWSAYLSPTIRALLPVAPETFLYVVGVIEVLVGLAVLTRWTAIGSYVAACWLVLIAANLTIAGFFDIAVRDLGMAVAAFTLARLTEVHETVEQRSETRRNEPVRRVA